MPTSQGLKANNLIATTVNDQVTLDEKGNALHHTSISYIWPASSSQNYGADVYQDYMRVYVPLGSRLQSQDGWQPQGESSAFNRQVWAGMFILPYGQIHTVTLVWTVPGAAKKNAQGWHYQYLIQQQASTQRKQNLHVQFPSCARITNQSGELLLSGKHEAKLMQLLTEDLSVDADYICK